MEDLAYCSSSTSQQVNSTIGWYNIHNSTVGWDNKHTSTVGWDNIHKSTEISATETSAACIISAGVTVQAGLQSSFKWYC